MSSAQVRVKPEVSQEEKVKIMLETSLNLKESHPGLFPITGITRRNGHADLIKPPGIRPAEEPRERRRTSKKFSIFRDCRTVPLKSIDGLEATKELKKLYAKAEDPNDPNDEERKNTAINYAMLNCMSFMKGNDVLLALETSPLTQFDNEYGEKKLNSIILANISKWYGTMLFRLPTSPQIIAAQMVYNSYRVFAEDKSLPMNGLYPHIQRLMHHLPGLEKALLPENRMDEQSHLAMSHHRIKTRVYTKMVEDIEERKKKSDIAVDKKFLKKLPFYKMVSSLDDLHNVIGREGRVCQRLTQKELRGEIVLSDGPDEDDEEEEDNLMDMNQRGNDREGTQGQQHYRSVDQQQSVHHPNQPQQHIQQMMGGDRMRSSSSVIMNAPHITLLPKSHPLYREQQDAIQAAQVRREEIQSNQYHGSNQSMMNQSRPPLNSDEHHEQHDIPSSSSTPVYSSTTPTLRTILRRDPSRPSHYVAEPSIHPYTNPSLLHPQQHTTPLHQFDPTVDHRDYGLRVHKNEDGEPPHPASSTVSLTGMEGDERHIIRRNVKYEVVQPRQEIRNTVHEERNKNIVHQQQHESGTVGERRMEGTVGDDRRESTIGDRPINGEEQRNVENTVGEKNMDTTVGGEKRSETTVGILTGTILKTTTRKRPLDNTNVNEYPCKKRRSWQRTNYGEDIKTIVERYQKDKKNSDDDFVEFIPMSVAIEMEKEKKKKELEEKEKKEMEEKEKKKKNEGGIINVLMECLIRSLKGTDGGKKGEDEATQTNDDVVEVTAPVVVSNDTDKNKEAIPSNEKVQLIEDKDNEKIEEVDKSPVVLVVESDDDNDNEEVEPQDEVVDESNVGSDGEEDEEGGGGRMDISSNDREDMNKEDERKMEISNEIMNEVEKDKNEEDKNEEVDESIVRIDVGRNEEAKEQVDEVLNDKEMNEDGEGMDNKSMEVEEDKEDKNEEENVNERFMEGMKMDEGVTEENMDIDEEEDRDKNDNEGMSVSAISSSESVMKTEYEMKKELIEEAQEEEMNEIKDRCDEIIKEEEHTQGEIEDEDDDDEEEEDDDDDDSIPNEEDVFDTDDDELFSDNDEPIQCEVKHTVEDHIKDTVVEVEKDTVIGEERNTVVEEEKDTVIGEKRDTVVEEKKDYVVGEEKDTVETSIENIVDEVTMEKDEEDMEMIEDGKDTVEKDKKNMMEEGNDKCIDDKEEDTTISMRDEVISTINRIEDEMEKDEEKKKKKKVENPIVDENIIEQYTQVEVDEEDVKDDQMEDIQSNIVSNEGIESMNDQVGENGLKMNVNQLEKIDANKEPIDSSTHTVSMERSINNLISPLLSIEPSHESIMETTTEERENKTTVSNTIDTVSPPTTTVSPPLDTVPIESDNTMCTPCRSRVMLSSLMTPVSSCTLSSMTKTIMDRSNSLLLPHLKRLESFEREEKEKMEKKEEKEEKKDIDKDIKVEEVIDGTPQDIIPPPERVSSSTITFHTMHGESAKLSDDMRTAIRTQSYLKALVFSSRPLFKGEKFQLKIMEIDERWKGQLRIGLTTRNPSDYKNESDVPNSLMVEKRGDHRTYRGDVIDPLERGSIVHCWISDKGDELMYSIEREFKGHLIKDIDWSRPLYLVLDVYAYIRAIRILTVLESSIDMEMIPSRRQRSLPNWVPEIQLVPQSARTTPTPRPSRPPLIIINEISSTPINNRIRRNEGRSMNREDIEVIDLIDEPIVKKMKTFDKNEVINIDDSDNDEDITSKNTQKESSIEIVKEKETVNEESIEKSIDNNDEIMNSSIENNNEEPMNTNDNISIGIEVNNKDDEIISSEVVVEEEKKDEVEMINDDKKINEKSNEETQTVESVAINEDINEKSINNTDQISIDTEKEPIANSIDHDNGSIGNEMKVDDGIGIKDDQIIPSDKCIEEENEDEVINNDKEINDNINDTEVAITVQSIVVNGEIVEKSIEKTNKEPINTTDNASIEFGGQKKIDDKVDNKDDDQIVSSEVPIEEENKDKVEEMDQTKEMNDKEDIEVLKTDQSLIRNEEVTVREVDTIDTVTVSECIQIDNVPEQEDALIGENPIDNKMDSESIPSIDKVEEKEKNMNVIEKIDNEMNFADNTSSTLLSVSPGDESMIIGQDTNLMNDTIFDSMDDESNAPSVTVVGKNGDMVELMDIDKEDESENDNNEMEMIHTMDLNESIEIEKIQNDEEVTVIESINGSDLIEMIEDGIKNEEDVEMTDNTTIDEKMDDDEEDKNDSIDDQTTVTRRPCLFGPGAANADSILRKYY